MLNKQFFTIIRRSHCDLVEFEVCFFHILKNGLNSGILKNYEFWALCVPIWRFIGLEVLHEYIIEYMEAVEPFSCSYCEKKLVLKDDLREYERIHSGEKSFSLLREEIRPEGQPGSTRLAQASI